MTSDLFDQDADHTPPRGIERPASDIELADAEPPAVVWLRVHDDPNALGRWSPTEIWNSHRYVLAPEGSAVIPPELVAAWSDRWTSHAGRWYTDGDPAAYDPLEVILRAAREGAS